MTLTSPLPLPRPPLVRLGIAPPSPLPRMIDGAWWPRSRDLITELPTLIAALPLAWGQITVATVSGAMWSALPSRMFVANHVVRLSRTSSAHGPHTICLLAPGKGRWDLLVVPPETTAHEAGRLLAAEGRAA
ncbi:hypothetical protein G5C51_35895 [Streptomyces sp. A7024]|uniref:Uncharacterized protein n=1 Tax=Streptomyces coryli TaxID=1128680 RepID=A0A6G4UD42_9ACTN|nr:DUF5994 family protein [Streptomyces coryli]NGN69257.1 hypothetical protein [Streptomyces coryli]